MNPTLIYLVYIVGALGATGVYAALPRGADSMKRATVIPLLAAAAAAIVYLLDRLIGSGVERWYFILLSLLAAGAAVRVITHPRPVYSALYFVLVVISTACLTVMAGAEFLGAALVIVYAGAILVTYVFVIMLAQQNAPATGGQFAQAVDYDLNAREPLAAVLMGFLLTAVIGRVIVTEAGVAAHGPAASELGNTTSLGHVLLTDYAISVELAGVLLMVAMIGAIVLARKNLPKPRDEGEAAEVGEIGKHVKPF